jgi:hypothetical protein
MYCVSYIFLLSSLSRRQVCAKYKNSGAGLAEGKILYHLNSAHGMIVHSLGGHHVYMHMSRVA